MNNYGNLERSNQFCLVFYSFLQDSEINMWYRMYCEIREFSKISNIIFGYVFKFILIAKFLFLSLILICTTILKKNYHQITLVRFVMRIYFSGGFKYPFNMVINLRVKTLDSQDHEFNVEDDVSIFIFYSFLIQSL